MIEVVVTHPSLSKFPICAAFGVPEIWSYDGDRLRIYRLSGPEYTEMPSSRILPDLQANELTDFLELGKSLDSLAWPERVLEQFRRSSAR